MRYGPPFDFTRRGDGRRLAYQVVGEGGLDLVFLLGWPTHLGLIWENPSFAAFLGKLSSFCRLILFDRLGDGLSDRGPSGHTFDDEMDDVRRVMAAAGSERAAFFGCHTGGRLALLLAATHPEEVSSVVAFGSHPATLRDDEYPWGSTPEEREYVFTMIETSAPSEMADALLALQAPREAADPSVRSWFRMFSASASSPVESIEGIRSLGPVDIRGLLGSIQPPVLILHRTGDRLADVNASRYMAERIPGARLVEHQGLVRRQLARFRGREVKTTGDGFLASFDGPARAIRSADAIRTGVRDQGLEVRAGLHTGECELRPDGISGASVEIGALLAEAAPPGEIIVSNTVRDLVAGSGLRFEERGQTSLGPRLGQWALFRVLS